MPMPMIAISLMTSASLIARTSGVRGRTRRAANDDRTASNGVSRKKSCWTHTSGVAPMLHLPRSARKRRACGRISGPLPFLSYPPARITDIARTSRGFRKVPQAGLEGASAANPKFASYRGTGVCELRVQSGTRIIDFASVPLIPRFASSVPQGQANLGIGTLGFRVPGQDTPRSRYACRTSGTSTGSSKPTRAGTSRSFAA
jgi:hypothetical protein